MEIIGNFLQQTVRSHTDPRREPHLHTGPFLCFGRKAADCRTPVKASCPQRRLAQEWSRTGGTRVLGLAGGYFDCGGCGSGRSSGSETERQAVRRVDFVRMAVTRAAGPRVARCGHRGCKMADGKQFHSFLASTCGSNVVAPRVHWMRAAAQNSPSVSGAPCNNVSQSLTDLRHCHTYTRTPGGG